MILAPRRAMQAAPGRVLRPVVALDIDGTMGYYHEHFLRFAAQWLQKTLPVYWDGSQPFWRTLGTSKAVYRQVKLCYRQGGLKRSMAPVLGAADLARTVRAAGAEVWVCTTRPYLRLDNIDPDTRFWLRHNRVQFDGVLFGENKYRDLANLVGIERVVAVLDDDTEQCARATRLRLPTHIIDRPYNRWPQAVAGVEDIPTCSSLKDARERFTELVNNWKIERGVR